MEILFYCRGYLYKMGEIAGDTSVTTAPKAWKISRDLAADCFLR